MKTILLLLLLLLSTTSYGQGQIPDSATVYVTFMVDTTGKVSDIKVKKIDCKKCDKEYKESLKSEAIRLIATAPPMPAPKQPTRYTQPLRFVVSNEYISK